MIETGDIGLLNSEPAPNLIISEADGGKLADNIMHFGRVLREAGLPVGPSAVLEAIRAISVIGVSSRTDFYWGLHAVFVNRREQRELFDQAFHFFWKNPNLLEKMMTMLLPAMKGEDIEADKPDMSKRLAEALNSNEDEAENENEAPSEADEKIDLDAALSFSKQEILASKDFEKMSASEYEQAKREIGKLTLPLGEIKTRRFKQSPYGLRADLRKTLREAGKKGGEILILKKKKRKTRTPPLVVLCDISGSMDRYSRLFLHFLYAITNDRDRVHTFLFGTRLTNVTRYLKARDPDQAIDRVSENVQDWGGGTRIGHTIHQFNKEWSRRVLGQNAMVLLISDGLDRDGGQGLDQEVERLSKSCKRLIWLNPLLRYDKYEPRARGANTLIKYVDEFRPIHNLQSLSQLTSVLGQVEPRNNQDMMRWRDYATV